MRTIFLDAVGLLALWDESDQWNASAIRAYEQFANTPVRLLTTSFILLECGNAAARRPYRNAVADLWHSLIQSGDLFYPTAEQVAGAWASYTARPAGSAGIVDLVSFAVMRDLGTVRRSQRRSFPGQGSRPDDLTLHMPCPTTSALRAIVADPADDTRGSSRDCPERQPRAISSAFRSGERLHPDSNARA